MKRVTAGTDFRVEFAALIKKSNLTQEQTATLLSAWVGENVSASTIRRWIAPVDTKYARHCPGWPVIVLRIALGKRVSPLGLASRSREDRQFVRSLMADQA